MNKTSIQSIIVCLLLILCTGCGKQKVNEGATAVQVEIARVAPSGESVRKEFPFIAKPLRTSVLSFRVSGPVERFESYAGNFYRKGSMIAEIDPRDFRIHKEQAEGIYRQAKAEYDRMESLYQKNNVSASVYEKARAAYVSAKTAYDRATNDLSDTRLQAPFDGYVGEVFIEKYQDVKATQPVVSFVDLSELRIEVYVPQEVAMQADSLNHVGLIFDHKPNQVLGAKVEECARSTTPNNLAYLLTVRLPNKDKKYSAGMSGKVFFDIESAGTNLMQIPQTALCHQPTFGDFVWVVDPASGKVSRRHVTLGNLQENGLFTITSGLKADEVVATSSLRFLSEGMTVQINDRPYVQPIANR